MNIFTSLFTPKQTTGMRINIDKEDIDYMKESNEKSLNSNKKPIDSTPKALDRKVLMKYEKKFIDRFKKIGNLNQKCPYCAVQYKSASLGEKKCLSCAKVFLVKKRVQDMGTVSFMMEKEHVFDLQWKAISKIKKFKYFLPTEYSYISNALTKKGKKHVHNTDIMYNLLSAYMKNSLNAGHYQLYTALLFHKAELMRSEQRFAEALECYFYIHFLHTNGVNNKAEFFINKEMNPELRERMQTLLDLGNIQIKKSKDIFSYALEHLGVFHPDSYVYNATKSYSSLIKEFRSEDEAKEDKKSMRSFVLYTKAS